MPNPKTTIGERLNAAQLAVQNSLCDEELLGLVGAYGYTLDKLNAGQALQILAQRAVNAHQAAAGAGSKEATAALVRAEAQARDAYQSLAKIARVLGDRPGLASLGLNGPEPQATAAFLMAAYTLFDNAGRLPALIGFGYDAARLSLERGKILAFDLANQRQEAAKGAAQQATRDQEAALAAMDQWTGQYLKVAHVALRSRPELLEKLGVLARSVKMAAQRAGTKKAAATRLAKPKG